MRGEPIEFRDTTLARSCAPPQACPALDGVTLQRLRTGTVLPEGGHRLAFVAEGTACVCRGRAAISLGAGELLHLQPGARGGDVCRAEGLEAWLLVIGDGCDLGAAACDPGGCAPAWALGQHTPAPFTDGQAAGLAVDDPAWWGRELAALDAELTGQRPGREVAVRARAELLLVAASRCALTGRPATATDVVAEALAVVDARFREPIGLREIAAAVGRSPAHLTDRVRRETGQPLGSWVRERRLAEARRLLLETRLPVAEVGARVGYPDPTNFARVFRSAHGLAPGAWRAAGTERSAESVEASAEPAATG